MKPTPTIFDQLLQPAVIYEALLQSETLGTLPSRTHSADRRPDHLPKDLRQFDDEIETLAAEALALKQSKSRSHRRKSDDAPALMGCDTPARATMS